MLKSYFLKNIQVYTFIQSFRVALKVVLADMGSRSVDTTIWVVLSIFCNGYVLPTLGMTVQFGSLLAVGHVVSSAVFSTYNAAMVISNDLSNEKTILFDLTLPMNSKLTILKIGLSWSVRSLGSSMLVLPLAILILWGRIDLSHFSLMKFIPALIMTNIMSGMFSVIAGSYVTNIMFIDRLWTRFIYPLWYLGGSIFPFKVIWVNFPILGKILLLNPVIYATEMVRASILSPDLYLLPYWLSFSVVTIASLIFYVLGFMNMKKRLGFV